VDGLLSALSGVVRADLIVMEDTERVTRAIDEALGLIFHDLAAGGVPRPRVEPTKWQPWEPSESVMLFAADRGGIGVWLDLTLSDEHALAHLADQVQEWIVEELWRLGRPTNWPICAAHPATHPRQAVVGNGRAVWACPFGAPDSSPIGELPIE
jgi:hypothetical protein